MGKKLEGKTAVVTGGGSGIGKVAADLTNTEDVTKVIDAVNERFAGQLDISCKQCGLVSCTVDKRYYACRL